MDLSTQRRLAADILGVGVDRVWMDPDWIDEISTAIYRSDVRRLIDEGAITARPKKSISKARIRKRKEQEQKGRGGGSGTHKGSKGARLSQKDAWAHKVRSLRRRLRELRDEGKINRSQYRELYRMVKGGSFRSKSHLESFLREKGMLEER